MPTPTPALTRIRIRAAYDLIHRTHRPDIWITLRPRADAEADARDIDERLAAGVHLPLAGRTLAVKGNIDVEGLPTTAGCPSYAYDPPTDAPAVARLKAAGAVVLGSTNMDQFATGLVGTRSPYGAVHSATDPTRVAGGSSSGSAVAVALGIADIALGTDTAGSGRVPAAFNGIVGLKPTCGLVPTDGVVPACASLDCVSVFARTLQDAELALALISTGPVREQTARAPGPWRIAVPPSAQLGPMDPGWEEAYEAAAARLEAAGAQLGAIDLTPFTDAASMLYEGAFVAERYTAVGAFIDKATNDLDPTVAAIIRRARDIPAHQLFADQARLAALRDQAMAALAATDADALLLPTAPGHPTLDDVAADPVGANARLGRFTNSTNLFDLAAVAVPAGDVDGRPFGVMLVGPPGTDDRLARIAAHLTPPTRLAVVGAHLTGQPLNPQLLALGATFKATTTTAPAYRLFALRTEPPKPGLVHVGTDNGQSIEAEIWELPPEGLGALTAALPRPMAIGRVELADGTTAPGFLCEPAALDEAEDITEYGGWRAYRNS
ncbi:allophanate hydrolase [Streptomyces sp. NPDC019443]|uniref:allophanate hydrolase n=1 Tax=Streptomyces sp. NPDC019443 TaxID=3365061 RepID=UPI0037AE9442